MSSRQNFSKWCAWEDRKNLAGITEPGVYLLALFDAPPGTRPVHTRAEVAYIGETCQQSLRVRLRQFGRSAKNGSAGHSGGKSARKDLRGNWGRLYLSILTLPNEEGMLRATHIRYLERKFLYEHTRENRRQPKWNSK